MCSSSPCPVLFDSPSLSRAWEFSDDIRAAQASMPTLASRINTPQFLSYSDWITRQSFCVPCVKSGSMSSLNRHRLPFSICLQSSTFSALPQTRAMQLR